MTLEEAIEHCEEVEEENKKAFRLCPYPTQECNGSQDCRCLENGSGKGCLKCAAEHRQLAEWLKELKAVHDEIDDADDEDEIFIGYLRKKTDGLLDALVSVGQVYRALKQLPPVQPEPLSDAYTKAVWTWLLDYQIKVAGLKGRYTPYEVLSWVACDWRKEHERSD